MLTRSYSMQTCTRYVHTHDTCFAQNVWLIVDDDAWLHVKYSMHLMVLPVRRVIDSLSYPVPYHFIRVRLAYIFACFDVLFVIKTQEWLRKWDLFVDIQFGKKARATFHCLFPKCIIYIKSNSNPKKNVFVLIVKARMLKCLAFALSCGRHLYHNILRTAAITKV